MDLTAITADLQGDEGFRGLLYDDATAKPVTKGSTLEGYPTIGYGWNVAAKSISPERAKIILGWFVSDTMGELLQIAPWVASLSPNRQRALGNLAYALGVHGLMAFTVFMGLMKNGDFEAAAEDFETTKWFDEVGDRAKRIQALVRAG